MRNRASLNLIVRRCSTARIGKLLFSLGELAPFCSSRTLADRLGQVYLRVDNLTTFARLYRLWVFLAWVVPGFGIGLFAIRNASILTVAAYLLGYAIYSLHRFASGSLHVGDFTVEQGLLLFLRELACATAVGAAAALAGAYIRRRLTIGSSDRGAAPSLGQGESR
jgi:hypothetical protein